LCTFALVTFTGYPASGKSKRAQELKSYLELQLNSPEYSGTLLNVVLISDDTLSLARNMYNDSRSEKLVRAALFTAVQRNMNPSTIVILDSLNYIKGYRYQLYCAAKEAGVRVCTIFVAATSAQCLEWNAAMDSSMGYAPTTLENLIMRYEEPSSMARWDSPLFTVAWDDEKIPEDAIWRAITQGDVKPANAGTRAAARAPTDALQTLENITSSILSMIMVEQASSGGLGGVVSLTLPCIRVRLQLPGRSISLSELQRLKRAFVTTHKKAITLGATEKGAVDFTEENVARKFVEYLEQNLQS